VPPTLSRSGKSKPSNVLDVRIMNTPAVDSVVANSSDGLILFAQAMYEKPALGGVQNLRVGVGR